MRRHIDGTYLAKRIRWGSDVSFGNNVTYNVLRDPLMFKLIPDCRPRSRLLTDLVVLVEPVVRVVLFI